MSFYQLSRKNRFKSWLHNKPDDEKAGKNTDDEDDDEEEDGDDENAEDGDEDEEEKGRARRSRAAKKEEEERPFYEDTDYRPDQTFLQRQGYRLQYGPYYSPSWQRKAKARTGDDEDEDEDDDDDEEEEAKKKEFTPAPEVFPKYHADHYKEDFDSTTHRSHFRPLHPFKPFPVRPMKINDLHDADFGTSLTTRHVDMAGTYFPKVKQRRRVSPATSADGFSDPESEDKEPEVLFYDGPVKYPDPGGPIKHTDPGYYLFKENKPWPMRVLDVGHVKPTQAEVSGTPSQKKPPSPKRTPTPSPPPTPPKAPTPPPTATPPRWPPPIHRLPPVRGLSQEELRRREAIKFTEVDSLIAGTPANGASRRIVLAPVYGATPLVVGPAPRVTQARPPPGHAPYLTRVLPASLPSSRPRMSAEFSRPQDPLSTAVNHSAPPQSPPSDNYRLAVIGEEPRRLILPRETRTVSPPNRSASPAPPAPAPPAPAPPAPARRRPKPSLKPLSRLALRLQKRNGLYRYEGLHQYDHVFEYEKGEDGVLHVVRKDGVPTRPPKQLRFAPGPPGLLPPEVVATISAYNVAHSG